jgi:heme exporter protein A
MTSLSLQNVTVERGGRTLFAPLSFTASGGTLVRIGGENGAGKTTLLRALAGLSQVASGTLHWLNHSSPSANGRSSIFVGHSNAMHDAMSPIENWAFAEGAAGKYFTRDEAKSALAALGVASLIDRRIGTLSQGQKKRVALARLLLPSNANAAWLLDEPFVALDAATQTTLATVIADALNRGVLVVLTSHQPIMIDAKNTMDISLVRADHGAKPLADHGAKPLAHAEARA